jgi:phosphoribosylamine--glycine ligase
MLMEKYSVKGQIRHKVVKNKEDAELTIREYQMVAVKPLGLTGGKGVRVSKDHFPTVDDAIKYADEWIVKDGSVLIEEELIGEEFTFQAFSDGSKIEVMPSVQDHKRAFVGDKGPNTGGMGSYSIGKLLPFLNQGDLDQAKEIMQQVVIALGKEGHTFVGVLYGQFMATKDGPKVIEFNSRFGDPEAMNVLSVLKTPLSRVFMSMAKGNLCKVEFENRCTVLKYIVPDGYPDAPRKDLEVIVTPSVARIYYASVYDKDGKIFTSSSRAFGILGVADTLEQAERIAEEGCKLIKGPVWHREDIGTAALIQKRIEHMKEIRGS